MRNCPICHGRGFVPYVKDGKVIEGIRVDCFCREGKEYYQPIAPIDFDFACSGSFRGYYHERYGGSDPAYVPPAPEAPPVQVIEHRHSDMSKREFARLENLEGQLKYLQGKIEERGKVRGDYY